MVVQKPMADYVFFYTVGLARLQIILWWPDNSGSDQSASNEELLAATGEVIVTWYIQVLLFFKLPALFQTVSEDDFPDGSVQLA